MFGYVVMNKPEIKFKDFDLYRSFYCGLCRELRDRYGVTGQISLTYDMTFVILLLSGLYEPPTRKGTTRCIIHPVRKQPVRKNALTEYAADMNVFLAYYKCEDDWQDEKKLWARIFSWMLMPKMKKIRKLYGEKAQMTADNLKALRELEKKNICDIDKSAGFFGRIMAELFVCREDEWAEKLRKMGFYFGKFIYLMDAYEDIEEDLKQNRYNPLAELYGQESFEENCQQILKMMMAETSRVFEQLPIVEEVEILRNILYAGVWSRYGQIRCSRKGTDKKE